jgi:hypothetical protein
VHGTSARRATEYNARVGFATTRQSPDAIAELAQAWRRYDGDPDAAIRAITKTAARALNVARAGVWLFSEDHSATTCIDLYEAAHDRHSSGMVVHATEYPTYFAALLEEDAIAADDAHTDPRTMELSRPYLGLHGIAALLDAPIRTGMRLVGILCHEHVGGVRAWTPEERRDAAFLASLASLTLELGDRPRREALRVATVETTGEGIVAFDGETVLAFNQRFLDIWQLDARSMRSLDTVREHIARRTIHRVEASHDEQIDILQLDDGRILERTNRPQVVSGKVIGRVWSFRDITTQRRADAFLHPSDSGVRSVPAGSAALRLRRRAGR